MNQATKDELKALAVAATLENGTNVTQKLKDLPEFLANQMAKVSDDEIFKHINTYSNITEFLPEEVGYQFLEAINFLSGTTSGEHIALQKREIDKAFIDSINSIEGFDDIDLYEKSELARIHLVRLIQSYQVLTSEITDAIKIT
jgi:hypothetical protein